MNEIASGDMKKVIQTLIQQMDDLDDLKTKISRDLWLYINDVAWNRAAEYNIQVGKTYLVDDIKFTVSNMHGVLHIVDPEDNGNIEYAVEFYVSGVLDGSSEITSTLLSNLTPK